MELERNSGVFPDTLHEYDINFTPAAQAKLAEIMRQADSLEAIRIFVGGGGCNGMIYGMTYANERTEYDSVASGPGFKVYVDAVALSYLQGCQVDFRDDGVTANFVFQNVFKSVGGSGTCGGCGGASGGGGGGHGAD